MIIRCQLVTNKVGRYFYPSLVDKSIEARKNNTDEIITIRIVKDYLYLSEGRVDKMVRWRERSQWTDRLGIDHQSFLVEVEDGNITQGDILNIEDNDLFVCELTDYKVK